MVSNMPYNCDQVTIIKRNLVRKLARTRKEARREALREELAVHPFHKDEELASRFGVSVSTIRLDRSEMGIPELRERNRAVANEAYSTLRALGQQEIVGNLCELVIGDQAKSELVVTENMVLKRARVARGHYLFAQANSLAIALVDAEVALTGSVELKFIRPARLGEIVRAEGKVNKRHGNKYWVEIVAKVQDDEVLRGRWVLFAFASSNN